MIQIFQDYKKNLVSQETLVLTKTEWEQGLGQLLHRLSEESLKN